jgi:hypothetical protein
MKNILKFGVLSMVALMPVITFAQGKDLEYLIRLAIRYLGLLIPFIMSLAIVVFIWGVYKYFIKVDADRAEAGNYILYSIIGFFLMLSLWGLVNILVNTFRLDPYMPGIPFIGTSGGNDNGNSFEFQGPPAPNSFEFQGPSR